MNTITVTVRGRTNTGKTTIAEIIYQALQNCGFTVERPRDAEPFNDTTTLRRTQAVSAKTDIYLKEVQVSDKGQSAKLFEAARAWKAQGARSKWSTKESLALWDLVEELEADAARPT